jgi:hypothetical protein
MHSPRNVDQESKTPALMRAAFFLFAIFALAGTPLGAGELFGARGHPAERARGDAYPGDLPSRFATPGSLAHAELAADHFDLVAEPLNGGGDKPDAICAAAACASAGHPYAEGDVQPERFALDASPASVRARAPPHGV